MRLSLHARAFDLLVFFQTLPYAATVTEIMASAAKLHTDVKFLVISEEIRQRPFGCATFTAEIFKPDRLRAESGRTVGREWPRDRAFVMKLFTEAVVQGATLNP
jgi:hypothetical protein